MKTLHRNPKKDQKMNRTEEPKTGTPQAVRLRKAVLHGGLRLAETLLLCLLAALLTVLSVSAAVCTDTGKKILTTEELRELGKQFDCVLVLGCGIYSDGSPSPMLSDRLTTAKQVLDTQVTDRILVSGDHRNDWYNEVGVMKERLTESGIASEQIFQDHDGYSTYDSIYRAKEVYGAKKIVIVTQKYHLYRALYLAEKLGMEAVGVAADMRPYAKQVFREVREIAARCKDVYLGLVQPLPEVMNGEFYDLRGNGNVTEKYRPASS